jgi:hypothetical protein
MLSQTSIKLRQATQSSSRIAPVAIDSFDPGWEKDEGGGVQFAAPVLLPFGRASGRLGG